MGLPLVLVLERAGLPPEKGRADCQKAFCHASLQSILVGTLVEVSLYND